MTGTAFDKLAQQYDALWSEASIGRSQRAEVWRWVDPLFRSGSRILDLGCGTGTDAMHFLARSVEVHGIDASAEMVRIARARGVDAQRMPIEAIAELRQQFDGAFSNFGALNCIANLKPVAQALAPLVQPGGFVAICVMGRTCAWEIGHYLLRGQHGKAFRRWYRAGSETNLGVRVYYPPTRQLVQQFGHEFRLVRRYGIGLCVPPSYVDRLSDSTVARLAAVDRMFAHRPILRALSDHQLLVFERV